MPRNCHYQSRALADMGKEELAPHFGPSPSEML